VTQTAAASSAGEHVQQEDQHEEVMLEYNISYSILYIYYISY
jgi:hypothetical protein